MILGNEDDNNTHRRPIIKINKAKKFFLSPKANIFKTELKNEKILENLKIYI